MEDVKEPSTASCTKLPVQGVSILVLMEDVKEQVAYKSGGQIVWMFQSLF